MLRVGCLGNENEERRANAQQQSKEIDPDPLTQIVFREEGIVTACVAGHVRVWERPGKTEGRGGGGGGGGGE